MPTHAPYLLGRGRWATPKMGEAGTHPSLPSLPSLLHPKQGRNLFTIQSGGEEKHV